MARGLVARSRLLLIVQQEQEEITVKMCVLRMVDERVYGHAYVLVVLFTINRARICHANRI